MTRKILRKIRQALHIVKTHGASDSLQWYLVKGASGRLAMRIVAIGFGFIANLLLARLLGAEAYGTYVFLFSWFGLLTVLATLGLDQLLIREIAAYHSKADWGLIQGILRKGSAISLLLLSLICLLSAGSLWAFRPHLPSSIFPACWILLMLLPLNVFLILCGAAMQGFRHIISAGIPGAFARPFLFIVALLLVAHTHHGTFTVSEAVSLGGLILFFTFLLQVRLLWKIVPYEVKNALPAYHTRKWLNSAFPIFLVAILHEMNLQIPTVMTGTLTGVEASGFYGIARLLASFVSFILTAANIALGPIVSSIYTSGEMQRLQKIITWSARGIFTIALLFATGILLLRETILQLFGPHFYKAEPVLFILLLGQLANTFAGSCGTLLIMTGHERDATIGIGCSTALTLLLSMMLIPRWGAAGAGIATTCSMILWNVLLTVSVRRRLGIDSTALGLLNR